MSTGALPVPQAGGVTARVSGASSASAATNVTVTAPVVWSGAPIEAVVSGGVLVAVTVTVVLAVWPVVAGKPKVKALSRPGRPWMWALVASVAVIVMESVPEAPAVGS